MRKTFLAALFFVLFAGTCRRPVPTADRTPPSIEWVVTNKSSGNNEMIRLNGDGRIDAKLGEEYQVTLRVTDGEGVHRISVGRSGEHSCSRDGAATKTPFSGGLAEDSFTTRSVLSERFLLENVHLTWTCRSGYTFAHAYTQLSGTGENYFGLRTTSTLTFSVVP